MASPNNGKILHQWSFPEFEHHQHSRGWRVGMVLLLVGGIALCLWYGNITLGFLLFAFGIVLIAREMQGPEMMRVYIKEGGLELILEDHHRDHRPSTCTAAWIDFQRLEEVLVLRYDDPEISKIVAASSQEWMESLIPTAKKFQE